METRKKSDKVSKIPASHVSRYGSRQSWTTHGTRELRRVSLLPSNLWAWTTLISTSCTGHARPIQMTLRSIFPTGTSSRHGLSYRSYLLQAASRTSVSPTSPSRTLRSFSRTRHLRQCQRLTRSNCTLTVLHQSSWTTARRRAFTAQLILASDQQTLLSTRTRTSSSSPRRRERPSSKCCMCKTLYLSGITN
jgi:hypothetical protein